MKTLKQIFPHEVVTEDLVNFTAGILSLRKTPNAENKRAKRNQSNPISTMVSEFLTCVRSYSHTKYSSVMKMKEVQILVNHLYKQCPENPNAILLKETVDLHNH